jgi:hypothetical protein
MKPNMLAAMALAVCIGACLKTTGSGTGQASSSAVRSVWKGDDEKFVSMFRKKQDDNLLRLAQERAAEKALEEQLSSPGETRESVPPSMYRTTEPPLPEPDLSLPVPDVPRPAPDAGSPTPSPEPAQ